MTDTISAEERVTILSKEIRDAVAPKALDDVLTTIQEMLVEREQRLMEQIFHEIEKAMSVECHDTEEDGMCEADMRIAKVKKEMCQ